MGTERNGGVTADPLFLGVTRPAMAFGVTYSALLANAVVTVELFLLTRNLLWLLACIPVHGLFWLLCLSEPRFFDLALLWGKTRGPGLFGNRSLWRAQGYSPLALDLPGKAGKRRAMPVVRVSAVDQATRLDVSSHRANARTWTSGLVRSEAGQRSVAAPCGRGDMEA